MKLAHVSDLKVKGRFMGPEGIASKTFLAPDSDVERIGVQIHGPCIPIN